MDENKERELKLELAKDKELEDYKYITTSQVEERRNNTQIFVSRLAAANNYALNGMRGILLLNGGAVITIFAYLGNLEKVPTALRYDAKVELLCGAMFFGGGFICGVFASGMAALAQQNILLAMIAKKSELACFTAGRGYRIAAQVSGYGSLVFFMFGVYLVVSGLWPIPARYFA